MQHLCVLLGFGPPWASLSSLLRVGPLASATGVQPAKLFQPRLVDAAWQSGKTKWCYRYVPWSKESNDGLYHGLDGHLRWTILHLSWTENQNTSQWFKTTATIFEIKIYAHISASAHTYIHIYIYIYIHIHLCVCMFKSIFIYHTWPHIET